jgi:sterol desaturase/sphingolipid hydroxylase (fatty acid hydroxylase superfamily)
MPPRLARLFNGELPAISERWRIWIKLLIALFSVQFALIIIASAYFDKTLTLGPGLVDSPDTATSMALATLQPLFDDKHYLFLSLYLPAAVLGLLWSALIVYRGFADYEKYRGKPYPLQHFATYFFLNALLVAMFGLTLLVLGVLSWSWQDNFEAGFTLLRQMTLYSQSLIAQVPTLLILPYPLPLIVTLIVVDFFFYWLHRLGHSQRLFWLLWHRPHHMPSEMVVPCTMPVFTAFPLFIVFAIPFQVAIGVLSKLFGPEAMILEVLVLRLLTHPLGVHSHCSAFYEWYAQSRIRMFLGSMLGVGNYHYVHHSALPGHGMINLGGLSCFYLWDKVFGTYVKPPLQKPPVGLTGSPKLHMNPLRLAFAGIGQIGYELKNNCGWKTRWKIVFGPSSWIPPYSKDFAIKE